MARTLTLATAVTWLVWATSISAQAPASSAASAAAAAPKRDLTGVWMIRNPAGMRGYAGATFTKEEPEMTPWAIAKYKEAKNTNGGQYDLETTNDPVVTKCYPPGTPRVYFHPYPFEFIPTPKYVLMFYEYDHTMRRIYTDGRPLPPDPDLTWMGTSVGRWENDTHLWWTPLALMKKPGSTDWDIRTAPKCASPSGSGARIAITCRSTSLSRIPRPCSSSGLPLFTPNCALSGSWVKSPAPAIIWNSRRSRSRHL